MREVDMTWTVHTLAKHCGVSDTTVKHVIKEADIPVYQRVGTYKLYDHRLLSAVRAYKIKMESPEWQAHLKQERMKHLSAGRDAYFERLRAAKLTNKSREKTPSAPTQQAQGVMIDPATIARIERKLDTILKELNVKFEE